MSDSVRSSSASESLDARQRSMLEAMGIMLWLPEASDPAVPVVSDAAPDLIPASDFKPNQPPALVESAQDATKIIATTPSAAPSTPTALSTPVLRPPAPIPTPERVPLPAGLAAMAWPELQRAVANCQACGLCASRKNTVFGVGPASSDALQAPQVDWLIVGEAPGEHEDLQGEPFVGQAGKLLDNMLAAMKVGVGSGPAPTGLSRRHGIYITNVLKCRPPANRNPSPEEVAMCEPYLARQIELLRPKVIVAMGKFAIQSLTGSTEAVGKLRGRVHTLRHPSYQAPVIVTYHPAYLLRNLPDKAKAWSDLLLAMQTYTSLAASA